jgi:drug/metabolite transporter (DMT)-like permease
MMAGRKPPGETAAPLAVMAAALVPIMLFALTPVTTRIVVRELDPLLVGMLRTAGAVIVTVPLLLGLRLTPPRDAGGWRLLLLNVVLTFTAFPVLFALGARMTSASHAALIMAATPIITGLTAAAVECTRPRGLWWLGCAVAFAGEVALVLTRNAQGTAATPLGDLLIFAACIGSGTGYVAGARLIGRMGAIPATLWSITIASLAQIPFIVLLWPPAHAWRAIDAAGWASLIHLTFGATVVALLIWFWALAKGGIARVAVLQFLQPALSLALAAMLLHEQLTPGLLSATFLILAGIVIARRR